VHEVTSFRFNDADPLIRLGRLGEADRLLRECQQVFEDHRDVTRLARVLSTRATLEDALGHREAAADFERTALRLRYARPEPRDIAISHHNLATHLWRADADRGEQRAHRLAAALICQLTGMAHDLAGTQRALAAEMREDGGAGALPAAVAEVVRVAEQTDGVRLGELIAALEPDPRVVEDALAQILRAAADLPPEEDAGIAGHLERWEPVIAAIAAARHGDQEAAAELVQFLDEIAQELDWAVLAGVLRRIVGGERDDRLLDGLDPVDSAIVRETLSRIGRGDPQRP